ncbi:MAG: A24 family peptidase [Nanoarchaeota archaeon]|nr:A24 family peptidase [Nanoarchaeota archaeon]
MLIILDVLLIAVVLIALLITSYTDLKTREVPDWISYVVVVLAVLFRLLGALDSGQWSYFWYGLLFGGIAFVLGLIMYYTKQWGGGDAKLLIGFGVVFATAPITHVPGTFLLSLGINILVIGALYGIAASLVIAIRQPKVFQQQYRRLQSYPKIIIMKRLAFGAALALLLVAFAVDSIGRLLVLGAAFVICLYPYVFQVLKAVEEGCMIKTISSTQLTEGDWLVDVNLRKKFHIPAWGIEQKHIAALHRAKIKQVLVKEGIPFVPALLLAVLATLLLGNIIPLQF